MSEHDLSEAVLSAAADRGTSLVVSDLLSFVERHEGPAVPRELLLAYADAVGGVERGTVEAALDRKLTDADSWAGPDRFYEVGDGISRFPSAWHALEGESDLTVYVGTITADADGEAFAEGGRGEGVPETVLVDAATVFGPYDTEEVREEVFRLRQADELVADADQSPQARVQLPADADPEVRRGP
jgi:hypothetical protein